MKKKLVATMLTLLAAATIAACGKSGGASTSDSSFTSSTSSKELNKQEHTRDVQRIGSDEYGYITIPKDWLPFRDLKGGDDIQYTDGTGYNIVTLNAFTREKANIEAGEELTAEMIANRIYYSWEGNTNVDEIWGAKTTVSGHETFQVNVILKSGQYLISWLFKEGDKVYLIVFEGSKEVLADMIDDIEHTWSKEKD